MTFPRILLKLGLVSVLVVAFCGDSLAAQRVIEKEFPVEPGARFFVNNHKGYIRIHTDDVDTIRIRVTISHEDEEVLDYVKVNTSGSPFRVNLDVDYKYSQAVGNSLPLLWTATNYFPDVDIEATLPDSASLEVDSHESEMRIEAPAGRIEIRSHKGRGTISGVRNDFTLRTHKGRFDVQIERLNDVLIDTHKGNIDLDIEEADNFRIDADTHKGNIDIRGKYDFDRRGRNSANKSLVIGTGEHQVSLDTFKGDISVFFRE